MYNKYIILTLVYILDNASGSSIDWVYDKFNIKLSYMFQFRDKKYGFLLPADQIIPNSIEVMDGLVAMINASRALDQI